MFRDIFTTIMSTCMACVCLNGAALLQIALKYMHPKTVNFLGEDPTLENYTENTWTSQFLKTFYHIKLTSEHLDEVYLTKIGKMEISLNVNMSFF